MKPKTALGIANFGIFGRLILNYAFFQLLSMIVPLINDGDIEGWQFFTIGYNITCVLTSLIMIFMLLVPLFVKDTFNSVIGKVFVGIAILISLVVIAFNIIAMFMTNTHLLGSMLGLALSLTIAVFILLSKSWMPVKISATVTLAILACVSVIGVIGYFVNPDMPFMFLQVPNGILNVLSLILSFVTILLTVIWMFRKEPAEIQQDYE
ncbi:MAG: hypothetical protein K2O00_04555 [Muribaculaceae bacterium]|nr:hypothetical protein [Muribaculaceae bacterium]